VNEYKENVKQQQPKENIADDLPGVIKLKPMHLIKLRFGNDVVETLVTRSFRV